MNEFKSLLIPILLQGMEFAQEPAKDFSFRRLSDVEGRLEVIRHYSASSIFSSKGKTYQDFSIFFLQGNKNQFLPHLHHSLSKGEKTFKIRIRHFVVVNEYIEASSLLPF